MTYNVITICRVQKAVQSLQSVWHRLTTQTNSRSLEAIRPLTYTIMAMSKYTTQPQTSAPRSPHFVVSSWTQTSLRMSQGNSLTGRMHKEKCNRGMNTGCRVAPPRTCRLGYSYLSPWSTSTSKVRESSSTSATSTTQGKGPRKEGITSPELPSPSQNAAHSAFFHLAREGQTLATECCTTSASTHTARHHLVSQTHKSTTTSGPYQLCPIPSGGPRLQRGMGRGRFGNI